MGRNVQRGEESARRVPAVIDHHIDVLRLLGGQPGQEIQHAGCGGDFVGELASTGIGLRNALHRRKDLARSVVIFATEVRTSAEGSSARLGSRARMARRSSTNSCSKYHLPFATSGMRTRQSPSAPAWKPVIALPPEKMGRSPGKRFVNHREHGRAAVGRQ